MAEVDGTQVIGLQSDYIFESPPEEPGSLPMGPGTEHSTRLTF